MLARRPSSSQRSPLVLTNEAREKAGISQATYFNWKKKYGGLLPTEMRRLKQLDDENSTLRKVVADLSLDKEMLSTSRGPESRRTMPSSKRSTVASEQNV